MTSALALRMAATFHVESEIHHRAGSECGTSIMPARKASQGARERDPAVAHREDREREDGDAREGEAESQPVVARERHANLQVKCEQY
jgi:hypothetical protein